jgi:hypothetical protein
MATIAHIVIGVISLLVKRKKLTREVFCWLAVGREHSIFFSRQKAQNERWEVVHSTTSQRTSWAFLAEKKNI